jgi:diaminohydroxyphosphoribosylaminopyrimidine deaminase/5-amino-6-(5-phosphoribosylamino)uracil reductase
VIYNENFILRALDLAKIGKGFVKTNPLVGAVLVLNNQIIGEGYHQKYGEAHAEVNAINDVLENFKNASELLKNATLYVTLEPCAHFGKTPPCADLIIKHKIPNVVIGCTDSFEQVNGKGIEKLKNSGVNVKVGVLEKECRKLNERFFTRIQKQRPFVILKWAETADGYFAAENGEQKWISGKEAKLLVHKWRTEEDCILVGKNTVKIDNPQLNVRLVSGKNPKRAVIDRNLELPKDFHVFDQSVETFVFNLNKTEIEGNTKYIGIEDFDYFLPQYILFQLYLQDIQSVIIEGGAHTLQQFIDTGLWDEARIFKSSQSWAEGIKSPKINGKQISSENLGSDQLIILTP